MRQASFLFSANFRHSITRACVTTELKMQEADPQELSEENKEKKRKLKMANYIDLHDLRATHRSYNSFSSLMIFL